MEFLVRLLSTTPDGGAAGIELLIVMVPALIVLGRSCRDVLRPGRRNS